MPISGGLQQLAMMILKVKAKPNFITNCSLEETSWRSISALQLEVKEQQKIAIKVLGGVRTA